MLVVSDSSPLNFLIRLDCAEVLPVLFGSILVPSVVLEELTNPATPTIVRDFVSKRPGWLEIRDPTRIEPMPTLDPGEEAAINLARELQADAVLIDDRAGRVAAAKLGLATIGVLGILERAAGRHLVDPDRVLSRLPTDYRIDPALVQAARERVRQRRER